MRASDGPNKKGLRKQHSSAHPDPSLVASTILASASVPDLQDHLNSASSVFQERPGARDSPETHQAISTSPGPPRQPALWTEQVAPYQPTGVKTATAWATQHIGCKSPFSYRVIPSSSISLENPTDSTVVMKLMVLTEVLGKRGF